MIPQDVVEMLSVDMIAVVILGLQCDETMNAPYCDGLKGPSHKAVVDSLVEAALRAGALRWMFIPTIPRMRT